MIKRDSRFIYSGTEYAKCSGGKPYVIVNNAKFFYDNKDEIMQWVYDNNNNDYKIEGAVIYLRNMNVQLMFKMRWEE